MSWFWSSGKWTVCFLRLFYLFKFKNVDSFDSVQDGSVAVFTPHTGFEGPTTYAQGCSVPRVD